MVSMRAPKRPRTKPTICMGKGTFVSMILVTITTTMTCVESRAEVGPIGAPV